ncbi:MAG: Periplasmic copper-binding protein (NosD) [Candidatus Argoarchaeum ethanivorans]|uniref:Periplasmic copper-binding protein (NosD) n=1 Tax=Candidatus Argoarchaeum ethanivorans TaxID=2608793 RepID=A0A811TCD6_9EURY|nr:MAG: Periplasmic copper-binding protein (NosD) [Candidatus Argoarchaeum ethanivorans]
MNNDNGIYLHDSSNNIVTNNIVSNNDNGIYVSSSSNNILMNNTANLNNNSIFLDWSSDNTISDNNCSNNGFGIEVSYSNNNIILNNKILKNDKGINLQNSNNNLIYLNDFVNTRNVYSSSSANAWNSTSKKTYTHNNIQHQNYIGNYWDDYKGSDKMWDGLGDEPYEIDQENFDHHPLMKAIEGYSPSYSQLWVSIIGRNQMRPGSKYTYYIQYGNLGNSATYDVMLLITIPASVEYSVNLPRHPLEGPDWKNITYGAKMDSTTVIPIWIYEVNPKEVHTISLTVKPIGTGNVPMKVELMASPPTAFSKTGDFNYINQSYFYNAMADSFEYTLDTLLMNSTAMRVSNVDYDEELLREYDQYHREYGQGLAEAIGQVSSAGIQSGIGFTLDCFMGASWMLYVAGAISGPAVMVITCGVVTYHLVSAFWTMTDAADTMERHINPQVVSSHDPNDKAGPAGFGDQHFVSLEEPLTYVIYFENLENATAPAQEVRVIDQLDTNIDWETFSFCDINVAGELIDIPEGSKEFSLTLQMPVEPWNGKPEAEEVNLNIEASFETSTGMIEWKFEGKNITTGELTDFLIPNKNPPKGDGWVMFTVQPNENLQTGTKIQNKATIVFDLNPPMDTPEIFNTIDSGMPSSHVEPLLEVVSSSEFDVRWNGTDGTGSGIKDYMVYFSKDEGPYITWLVHTTDTSAVFIGESGYTYAFYSIARDNVGHIEETPEEPDATTFIDAPINQIPVALFNYAPLTPAVGEEITFNASSSHDPDGYVAGYAWDFGDGNITNTTEVIITHFYSLKGDYNVSLTVTDNAGAINLTSKLVPVQATDTMPPECISNLDEIDKGVTWINWTWTNPPDPDFNHTEIYLNGVFQTITSAEFFNATNLTPETSYTISTRTVDTAGNINQTWVNDTATTLKIYNITFLPPITTPDHFNLKYGRTLPIKFTARDNDTGEFIYDNTVNVTITNSTGHLITYFTNGTGTDSIRINSTEEQYIVNFHTKNYDLNVGETYTIHVAFGEVDALRGYAIAHFTLVSRSPGKKPY